MKFVVSKANLLKGLNAVRVASCNKSVLPILANVMLEAKDDTLTLTVTDLELTAQCTVPANVKQAGSVTVPAKMIGNIAKELDATDITIESDDKQCVSASIVGGDALFKVNGMSIEEFPPLPTVKDESRCTMQQSELRDRLIKTSYAASSDETRLFLNGVLMSVKGKMLSTVATDGRRLALVENATGDFAVDTDMILPSKTVNALLSTLTDEGDVTIASVSNQVVFTMEGLTIYSKLIEGTYPNFRHVIPKDSTFAIPVKREDMLAVLKRVSLLTSERSNSVKLTFSKNSMIASASTPDIGEAKESVPVKFDGPELSVAFNPEFLMDPLRKLDCEEVTLNVTDDVSPCVVKAQGFTYVIMPMRVG